jgi:hypothetical protein
MSVSFLEETDWRTTVVSQAMTVEWMVSRDGRRQRSLQLLARWRQLRPVPIEADLN